VIRHALLAVALVGCSSSVATPMQETPVRVEGEPAADAGPDVQLVPLEDASSNRDPDTGIDSSMSPDADIPDVLPNVDSSADGSTLRDTGVDAPAPDHVGSVWCSAGGQLYVGCDGQYHAYSVSGTGTDGQDFDCQGTRTNLRATCAPGATCYVSGTDAGFISGTCE